MIVLKRQRNESIIIGDDIEVTLVDIRGDVAHLGITAPAELTIHRKEVYEAIRKQSETANHVIEAAEKNHFNVFSERVASQENLKIHLATELDLPTINEIYNHYVHGSTCTYQETSEPIEGRQEWYAKHGLKHPVTVALLDRQIVGWGSLSPYHARSAYRYTVENSLYVHHEFHGRGIGSIILRDLIDRARAIGHRAIIAGIDAEQSGSVALHEKFGFQNAGHLKKVGFKFGRWLDVIYMQLSI
jgi:carbon storage regulator CsrA